MRTYDPTQLADSKSGVRAGLTGADDLRGDDAQISYNARRGGKAAAILGLKARVRLTLQIKSVFFKKIAPRNSLKRSRRRGAV